MHWISIKGKGMLPSTIYNGSGGVSSSRGHRPWEADTQHLWAVCSARSNQQSRGDNRPMLRTDIFQSWQRLCLESIFLGISSFYLITLGVIRFAISLEILCKWEDIHKGTFLIQCIGASILSLLSHHGRHSSLRQDAWGARIYNETDSGWYKPQHTFY